MEKNCYVNSNPNRTGVAIFISDKIDIKKRVFLATRRKLLNEDIKFIIVYTPRSGTPREVKQKIVNELGRQIDNSIVSFGNLFFKFETLVEHRGAKAERI
jgi:hypothetical protein